MKTGLVIVTKDRPQYLRRCLDSLSKADLEGVTVWIVDDGSGEAVTMMNDESGYNVWRMLHSGGIKNALMRGFDLLIEDGCDFLINLDSDAIVTPDFVRRLEALHEQFPLLIVSGFNPGRDVEAEKDDAVRRSLCNGINMGFSARTYKNLVTIALKMEGHWDYNVSKGHWNIITKPSCVQHIGYISSMGHSEPDIAIDFPPTLHLPDVTLFGIDSHDKEGILKAAKESNREVAFGSVNIITDDLFTPNGTREQRREDYSRFCIQNLHKHFHTSHVLIIHADGYIVNPLAWRNEWLQYDYIGAPWWFHKDEYNVGNGGFSLRSHKLCKYLSEANLEHMHPEDHHICRTYRAALEEAGFKFAPEEVARQFSVEGEKYAGSFGFHGTQVDFTGADIARLPYRPDDSAEIALKAWKARNDRWKNVS